jgi:hypothetical protein
MASKIREILERVARGETDSESAAREISAGQEPEAQSQNEGPRAADAQRFLKVEVRRLSDDQPKVYVRVPLRMVKWGLQMGSRYAPELEGMDLDPISEDLYNLQGGRIVEVHDVEDDEHVVVSVE